MTGDVYDRLGDPLALGVFVLTLLIPVAVGLLALARTRSQSDFFLGGRSMSSLVVGLSAVSSGRSSWLVLGLSGMAYVSGVGAPSGPWWATRPSRPGSSSTSAGG